MTIIDKLTLDEVEVYDIRYDQNGYPNFLIYSNGQWLIRSAKHYKPKDRYYE